MKENKLSVWTFPYRPLHYLTHPHKFARDLYWNCRNFLHRGRYGYAYVDVWNFCDWYPRVAAEALRYLAKRSCGYPGVEPWDTPQRWEKYLRDLAEKLELCADHLDICNIEERNEYAREFHSKAKELTRHRKQNADGSVTTWQDTTPEFEEIREKYFARDKEIQDADEEFSANTFAEIGRNLGRLWD